MMWSAKIIASLWVVFLVIWVVSAFGAKKTANDARYWRRAAGFRLSFLLLALLAARHAFFRRAAYSAGIASFHAGAVASGLGVAFCAAGVGLAIWARLHIGSNWGAPMSKKADPELVATGPYRFIRHPIYAGIMLAVLGSALGANPLWGLALLLLAGYFLFSAKQEERFMTERFPEDYPAYVRRTHRFVPFIW